MAAAPLPGDQTAERQPILFRRCERIASPNQLSDMRSKEKPGMILSMLESAGKAQHRVDLREKADILSDIPRCLFQAQPSPLIRVHLRFRGDVVIDGHLGGFYPTRDSGWHSSCRLRCRR